MSSIYEGVCQSFHPRNLDTKLQCLILGLFENAFPVSSFNSVSQRLSCVNGVTHCTCTHFLSLNSLEYQIILKSGQKRDIWLAMTYSTVYSKYLSWSYIQHSFAEQMRWTTVSFKISADKSDRYTPTRGKQAQCAFKIENAAQDMP